MIAETPDLFHRYLDRRMRRARGLGNGSQFVFELGAEVSADAVLDRLAPLASRLPLLQAGLPSWPRRRWEPRSDAIAVHEEPIDGSLEAWFARWFGEPFRPLDGPSLEIVLGRHDAGTAVLVRWLHALSDAPGMDLLLRLLDGEDPERFRLEGEAGALVRRVRGKSTIVRRAFDVHALALRQVLRTVPPAWQARVDRRARQTVACSTFTADETADVWARGRELASLDRNSFLVGALARATVRAFDVPGWRRLRIPVPISLRPPAWRGPVLGNWFSIVLLELPVRRLRSLEEAVETTRAAWKTALARGEDRATLALMGAAATFPPWLARLLLDGPLLRDGASVNSSYVELKTGASGTFLDQPLERGIIASSILAPPGLAGVFAGCAGRLSVSVPGQGEVTAVLHDALVALLRGDAT